MTEMLETIHRQLDELYRTEASLELADPEDLDAQLKLRATQATIRALHLRENELFIDDSQQRYRKRCGEEMEDA